MANGATEKPPALVFLVVLLVLGCEQTQPEGPKSPRAGQLTVEQVKAYEEAATGVFLSLADFEDSPDGRSGQEQLKHFSIIPGSGEAACRFSVNERRTGAGAVEVTIPAGGKLTFTPPETHDFTGYSLLGAAVYSTAFRDELQMTVVTQGASWQSGRMLVKPGWNTVLFDIRRPPPIVGLDLGEVRAVEMAFTDAAEPVSFALDDIMLINNLRVVRPSPFGMTLQREGLDYRLAVNRASDEFLLAAGLHGFWQLGRHQAVMQLAGEGENFDRRGVQLALLGSRRIGQAELLECNAVRVRFASTWYFPARSGEWLSAAVRRIEWRYTFYADGRWVTHVELNNAGGRPVESVRIILPSPAAWAGGTISNELLVSDFRGPVGRWSYVCQTQGDTNGLLTDNYLSPGHLIVTLGSDGPAAEGDADKDGFDESEGCYFLRAKAGHCRFTIIPPPGGLFNPAFRVAGEWVGQVSAGSEGLAIRDIAVVNDESVVFVLPGLIEKPTAVEVSCDLPRLANR